MTHASIPTIYWDDIFSSIFFLINRLPSFIATVPYTSLFLDKPDYTFLRVLGCLCFPLTRPYNEHKLQPRTLPCVFIGYATSQKGYRCLHLSSNKNFVSRNVIFDEAVFPFHHSSASSTTLPAVSPLSVSNFSPGLTTFSARPSPVAAEPTSPSQPNTTLSPLGPIPLHSPTCHPLLQHNLPLLDSPIMGSTRPDPPLSPSPLTPDISCLLLTPTANLCSPDGDSH